MGGPAIINGHKVREFDNFYRAPFVLAGKEWPTVEHYFQAQKEVNIDYQEKIRLCATPHEARDLGQKANLRPYWEEIKAGVMWDANQAKFTQNYDLASLLCSLEGEITFNRSSAYWNKENARILTDIRRRLMDRTVLKNFPGGIKLKDPACK